jgi:hypothetical protein
MDEGGVHVAGALALVDTDHVTLEERMDARVSILVRMILTIIL